MSLSIDVNNEAQVAKFIDIASRTNSYLVIGLPERSGDKVFNSSILVAPTGKIYRYRKIHLFDKEKNTFSPGNEAPKVYNTEFGKLGMMICFDWIFPEICRLLALEGAQIICHPSNLVLSYCQRAMYARSVENGVFTLTCNRTGSEYRNNSSIKFTGRSQILSPKGEVLGQGSETEEAIISSKILVAEADNKRITKSNHLIEDRQPELYRRLQQN